MARDGPDNHTTSRLFFNANKSFYYGCGNPKLGNPDTTSTTASQVNEGYSLGSQNSRPFYRRFWI